MSLATAGVEPEVLARARVLARELATIQCEPEEIVAALEVALEWGHAVTRDDAGTVSRARQWAIEHADDVTRWRLVARVELRREIWEIASGKRSADAISSARERLLTELMRQHCGWARQAPLDKLMDAYFAAQRDQDRKARAAGHKSRLKAVQG